MANECNIAGELYVDLGDGWRHFDKRSVGTPIGNGEAANAQLPASSAQTTIEKKKK